MTYAARVWRWARFGVWWSAKDQKRQQKIVDDTERLRRLVPR